MKMRFSLASIAACLISMSFVACVGVDDISNGSPSDPSAQSGPGPDGRFALSGTCRLNRPITLSDPDLLKHPVILKDLVFSQSVPLTTNSGIELIPAENSGLKLLLSQLSIENVPTRFISMSLNPAIGYSGTAEDYIGESNIQGTNDQENGEQVYVTIVNDDTNTMKVGAVVKGNQLTQVEMTYNFSQPNQKFICLNDADLDQQF